MRVSSVSDLNDSIGGLNGGPLSGSPPSEFLGYFPYGGWSIEFRGTWAGKLVLTYG
jgi:hypothetical protein